MKKYLVITGMALLAFASAAAAQNFTFNNDLTLGASGDDVVNLQSWLLSNGFNIPSLASGATAKGYFGQQTRAAVAAYQQSIGLPAYGFFGPMTRARLNDNGGFRGNSLQVTSPNGGEVWQKGTTHNITWTGASGLLNQTADIRLEYALPACARPGQIIRCMILVRAPLTIATGVNLSSGSYSWVAGYYQLGPGHISTPDCFGGNTSNCISSSYFVDDGQYRIQICPTNGSQCDESDNDFTISSNAPTVGIISPNGGETIRIGDRYPISWNASSFTSQNVSISLQDTSKSCPAYSTGCWTKYGIDTVQNTGSYVWDTNTKMFGDGGPNSRPVYAGTGFKIFICAAGVTAQNACDSSDNTFTITATQGSGNQPVISGIDAPTTLTVNQTGTWTIHATDPLNGTLSYSILWGDEPGYATSGGTMMAPAVAQTSTFTHAYANAGVYTVTFTVRNSAGQQVQTSSSVQVTGASQAGPLKIVTPNGGEVWVKGTTQNITWTSPYYFAAATADLKIQPAMPYCGPGMACIQVMPAPYTIASGIPINQNSYSWTVGNALPFAMTNSSLQTVPDGQYTVQICQSGSNVCDSSDSTFTITSNSNTQPSITVVSPNGGESWTANSTHQISWSVSNASGVVSQVDLYLGRLLQVPCAYNVYSSAPNNYCLPQFQTLYTLDRNIAANAIYNWIVATDISNNAIPAGSYAVRICAAGSTSNCDTSNSNFNILGAGYPPNVICPAGYSCTPIGNPTY